VHSLLTKLGAGPRERSIKSDNMVPGDKESARTADLQPAALLWTAGFVALLLAGGLVFTFREFRRLPAQSAGGVRRLAILKGIQTWAGRWSMGKPNRTRHRPIRAQQSLKRIEP
jgi:hypothetical protein